MGGNISDVLRVETAVFCSGNLFPFPLGQRSSLLLEALTVIVFRVESIYCLI